MAKSTSVYICQQCSYQSPRWLGKCPECGTWGSMVETITEPVTTEKAQSRQGRGRLAIDEGEKPTGPVSLRKVTVESTTRIATGLTELDRALGGGIVPGQVVLLAGEPGIGKSTLLLQVASNLAKSGMVFYASAEESAGQIKLRADRLKIKEDIVLIEETEVDGIIQKTLGHAANNGVSAQKKPSLKRACLIVDSIQTIYTNDLRGFAGSVGQVRECTYRLVNLAKSRNIPVFIVGHVTKEGTVAGPAVLSHLVDTVLWFEGDKTHTLRMLRAVKNRFGPTDEVGIFEMEEKGLVSLANPEGIFLSEHEARVAGSALASIMQGLRAVLVEVQALVVPTKTAYPRRIAQGIDSTRFELLLAVLTRRCGLALYDYDCYINISGGIAVKNDPAIDLAVCMSVASAYYDKALPDKSIAIGEVGLLGDIRKVTGQEKRIKEAKRLGYKNIISKETASGVRDAIKKFVK